MANLKHLGSCPNSSPRQNLGILGTSVRAAAFSAVRAGVEVRAADRYGDADLRAAVCHVELAAPFREKLPTALESLDVSAWMYTGGLDDAPEIVDRLATLCPLLGNPGHALRRVRDPFRLSKLLTSTTTPLARVLSLRQRPKAGSGWILKRSPFAADGGTYFQRWIDGESASALFVAGPGATRLLGATRQLVGEEWLHAPRLGWCGNVGPLDLPEHARGELEALGTLLSDQGELRGIFGVDFVWQAEGDGGQGRVVPLEVNPRYTGSVEVLEHALGFSAIALHLEACGHPRPPATECPAANGVVGKAVVYAPYAIQVEVDLCEHYPTSPLKRPAAADLPPPGSTIDVGEPLLSVFAEGASVEACQHQLTSAAADALALVATR